jgi:tetratricopeptide (TPR) repeat protein
MTKEEKTERYRTLVEECLKAQRYEEAVTFYRQLIDLNPGDDSYLVGLAWAYHDSGNEEQAVACFEQILERELQRRIFTGFAFDELVRIFKESGQFDRLVTVCERAAAVQPGDVALLSELGDAYLKAGRPGEAVGVFSKIMEMEPDDPVFFCSLGQALIMSGDPDGGEAAYRQAAAIDPSETGRFYARMANAYLQAGQMERAEKAYRSGLTLENNDPLLQLSLGDLLIRQGRQVEGESAYDKAIEMNSASAGAYLNRLGNTLARTGCHQDAVAAFKKAIALDGQNPFYYLYLSESYQALGRAEDAIAALRQAEAVRNTR